MKILTTNQMDNAADMKKNDMTISAEHGNNEYLEPAKYKVNM